MFNFSQYPNAKRRVVQFFSLLLLGEWSIYGIFRCPFAVPYVSCGNCPVVQCPGRSLWLWSWIAIIGSALLFGRAFCGWACPGGLLAELLAYVSIFKKRVHSRVLQVSIHAKYLMLIISCWYLFILNNPRWAIPIRTGEFFNAISLTFEHANQLWIWKTAALLFIFVFPGLFIPRIWCRFLCPTGGLLELAGSFSLLKTTKKNQCTDCGVCQTSCSMDTTPDNSNCTNCGTCISACPTTNIQYTTRQESLKSTNT